MSKTVIITESMLSDIKDMLTMTQFKFKSNVKKFLAGLLEDPVGTDVDQIFKHNGIDKNKLIKVLVDNKAITKKMTIDDHDSDGNPHTAKMIVRYSVPKERFNDRLDAIYDILFPDMSAKINEDGGGAASCSGVDGNGFGSGEYVQPLFGGVTVTRKKKEGKRTVGGDAFTELLSESIEEYSDSAINTDDFSTLPSFAKQVAFCKEKLGFPIGNGSSRMVFRVDDNRVLKLAKNRKGIAQNEAECENSNDYYMGYMFAKVFDYDKNNFTYIVAEEARPPKADDFRRILGVSYNEFWRICMGAEAEYNPRSYSGHKLSQEDYDLLEENEPLREWYDYITNYQPTSVFEIIRKCNLGVAHRNDGDAIIITDSGFNDDVKDLYQKRVNEGRKKVNKNDKGEVVPETCTCGGKVTLQIKGEPVYICKECGKYYGTMPFHRHLNEGAWGSNPLQSDGGLDKRDDVVADAFKYIVNHIEKNGKYESDNNYHWLGVVLWTMNRFKGSYFKSTLEKSGLDKAVKDVVKNLSKDEKFIGGWSKETQNEVRKYINDFEKQYNELKEKYAIDGDNYKRENDGFEGKGLMDTIAEKDILKEAVTGEDADKSAALYVYNKDKDENWYILCARRSNRKDDEEGGKWNPPMGHLHKGESMKDGALRECLEESGIDFSKYKKEIKIRDHHTWGSNCTLQLGDYVRPEVTIDDFEPKKGDEENSKFIWLPLEDIKSKTWAWSCGENAYKFIPGEIDLIQEFDFHKAYKNLLDRRGEVELDDGAVVPKYKTLTESELISPEDAIKGGFAVSDSDRSWKEGEFVEPKKTGIGYKVFYRGKDGNLYPPMIANDNGEPTPMGQWLPASSPVIIGYTSKEHRPQVQSGGKGTKGGSNGPLAFRPGWHMGEIPYAPQFLKREKINGREIWPASLVWAECEYCNDIDYQEEAMSYGYGKSGKFMHSRAGLPKIPKGGSYRYRTNPNPNTVPWIISGAMKVNKLLDFDEVARILEMNGIEAPIPMTEKEYKTAIANKLK